ncbi:MAG: hypothetical protein ACLPVF_16655 [Acidimicrobiales bacterium]
MPNQPGNTTPKRTIRDLILEVLGAAEGPMFIDDITRAVVDAHGHVKANSVRTEISALAAGEPPKIHRIRRSWFTLPDKSSEPADDLQRVTDQLRLLVEAAQDTLVVPDGYRSAALALIDAVFSSRSHYSSVKNVIDRVTKTTNQRDEDTFTVAKLLSLLDQRTHWREHGPDIDAELADFFGNRSSAPGGGWPKARLVVELGQRMIDFESRHPGLGIQLDSKSGFAAIEGLSADDRLAALDTIDRDLSELPGVGTATTRYLLLLMGVQVVKPDRMLIRWVQGALGGEAAPPSAGRTAELLEQAIERLQHEGCRLSVREIDHLIWRVQSGRQVMPGTASHRLGPSVVSGIASRRATTQGQDFLLEPGTLVDLSPVVGRKTTERWHGEIAGLSEGGRVPVRWTSTDSVRALRGTRSFGAYEEMVPIADLVPCDPAGPRHPADQREVRLVVGDEVDWDPTTPAKDKWHGRIVGRYRDRFIVEWTATDSERPWTIEDPDAKVELPLYEVNRAAVLRACDGGDRHPILQEP